MGDSRSPPAREKRVEYIKRSPKEIIVIQKPKSKTRVNSPETYLKPNDNPNRSSQSNISISIHGQVVDARSLEPKYRDLLAKYLAASSRQNSPQDPKISIKPTRPEKKIVHRKSASNTPSSHVSRQNLDPTKANALDNCGSQDRTIKNDAKRAEISRSSSSRSVGSSNDLENSRKRIMESIVLSIHEGEIIQTNASFYMIGKQLGKGAFGKVYLGLHRITGLKVAIKTIDKSIMQDERTKRKVFQEVYVMKKINHPNVIRLLEVFESSRHLMIVLEYSGGGDLLQLVKSRGNLSETEGKHVFSQVVESIKACHAKNIIHRDVKLDNILITTDFNCVKLCDFGVSRSVKPGERIFDQCGTPAYLAPEIVADRGYDPFYVDIWSMGVLLYAILSGTVPFRAKSLPELHKLILRCKYEMPPNISETAQDLIRRMLNPIPHMRITLEEMTNHPWLVDMNSDSFIEDSIAPRFSGGLCTSVRKVSEKEIFGKMKQLGFPVDFVYQSLKFREINHATATYYLLEISS